MSVCCEYHRRNRGRCRQYSNTEDNAGDLSVGVNNGDLNVGLGGGLTVDVETGDLGFQVAPGISFDFD
jgi:hypothetical protein